MAFVREISASVVHAFTSGGTGWKFFVKIAYFKDNFVWGTTLNFNTFFTIVFPQSSHMAYFVSCQKKLPTNLQRKRTVQRSWKTRSYNISTDLSGISLLGHLHNKRTERKTFGLNFF